MSEVKKNRLNDLFGQELQVINVGLCSFAEAIRQADGTAENIEWKPPARGDQEIGQQLAQGHEPRPWNRLTRERLTGCCRHSPS